MSCEHKFTVILNYIQLIVCNFDYQSQFYSYLVISDKLSVKNIIKMYGVGFLGSNAINIFIYLKKHGCVFSKHVLHPELKFL